MIISHIVAVSKNYVIGQNNSLPWSLPADMAYFQKVTMGHNIIMGRKNFESEGGILSGRTNIIITSQPDYNVDGGIVAHSMNEALDICRENHEEEAFIIGGGEIYKQSLDMVDRIYITIIDVEIEGDVYYPKINFDDWNILSKRYYKHDQENVFDHTYYILERKTKN